MTLSAGTRLGPYEILSPLGAGGMGEVYRARDSKLRRDVAIKVLPQSLATDPEALARFEREALAVAALSHPNILSIFDFGRQDGILYSVMELLEGETLRARLSGPLPPRKAAEYAAAVARGFAAAHEKGIVHRDLKPENLFVTKDGHLKILDFGLAKKTENENTTDETFAPTQPKHTEPGAVMGTVGYMSPEQVRGLPVDHRSDIFSLGVVFFEMLTGVRAFHRETAAETMTAILREEPLEVAGRAPISPAFDRIVRHCLEKDPAGRFQSARDLAFDLESLSSASGATLTAPTPPTRLSRTRWLAGSAFSCLAVALFLGSWLAGRSRSALTLPQFHRVTFRRGNILSARFTSDGQNVVYGAAWDGRPSEVFAARADGTLSRPIGVENADVLAVSPTGLVAVLLKKLSLRLADGEGTLAVLPLEGGTPRQVAENVEQAAYDKDGQLAVIRIIGTERRLEYPIGNVVYRSTNSLSSASVSPRGEGVAVLEGSDPPVIRVIDRKGGSREVGRDWQRVSSVCWAPEGGKLLIRAAHKGTDFAILELSVGSGRERVVLQPAAGSMVLHDVSSGGRLLVERKQTQDEMAYFGEGIPERNVSFLDGSLPVAISDDGRALLFTERKQGGGPGGSVFLRRLEDATPPVKLFDGGHAYDLSNDGRWALVVTRDQPPVLELVPTGPGQAVTFGTSGLVAVNNAVLLHDAHRALINAQEAGKGWGLYAVATSGASPRRILSTRVSDVQALALSPGDKTVASLDTEARAILIPLAGGSPQLMPGLRPPLIPLKFKSDGRSLLVVDISGDVPVSLFIYDLATAALEPWRKLMPTDSAGVTIVNNSVETPDFKSVVYGYSRVVQSDLYVVEGVR